MHQEMRRAMSAPLPQGTHWRSAPLRGLSAISLMRSRIAEIASPSARDGYVSFRDEGDAAKLVCHPVTVTIDLGRPRRVEQVQTTRSRNSYLGSISYRAGPDYHTE